jgi:hypothetical protein
MYSPPLTRKRARMLKENPDMLDKSLNVTESKSDKKSEVSKKTNRKKSKKIEDTLVTDDIEIIVDINTKSQELMHNIPVVDDINTTSNIVVIHNLKKLEMSTEEMSMNGAPDGTLYDVKVFADNELEPLQFQSFNQIVDQFNNSLSTWGEKYSAIENIRKITLFHEDIYTIQNVEIILQMLNESLNSLRSCIVRNAILCAEGLFRLEIFNNYAKQSITSDMTFITQVLLSLMNKTVNGPKFLCEAAISALEKSVLVLNPLQIISVFGDVIEHKNAEICNRSYIYISNAINKYQNDQAVYECNIKDENFVSKLIIFMIKGVNSKRPSGREVCKQTLHNMFMHYGDEQIQKELLNINKFYSDTHNIELSRLYQLFQNSNINNTVISSNNSSSHSSNSIMTMSSGENKITKEDIFESHSNKPFKKLTENSIIHTKKSLPCKDITNKCSTSSNTSLSVTSTTKKTNVAPMRISIKEQMMKLKTSKDLNINQNEITEIL